jgi:Protein of unknown function (DUF2510)
MNDSALSIFLLVLFGLAGYRYSARNEVLRGTTPWHIPSAIWSVICLATGPFGLLLEYVAVRTTKPVSLPLPAGSGGSTTEWAPVTAPEIGAVAVPNPTSSGHPAANDGSGKMALFGWYPDPTSRHERRYWDGKGWTTLVEDHLVTGDDPL